MNRLFKMGSSWLLALVMLFLIVPLCTAANLPGDRNYSGKHNVRWFYIDNVRVTATAAELNLMDGLTATAVELNQLDADGVGISSVSLWSNVVSVFWTSNHNYTAGSAIGMNSCTVNENNGTVNMTGATINVLGSTFAGAATASGSWNFDADMTVTSITADAGSTWVPGVVVTNPLTRLFVSNVVFAAGGEATIDGKYATVGPNATTGIMLDMGTCTNGQASVSFNATFGTAPSVVIGWKDNVAALGSAVTNAAISATAVSTTTFVPTTWVSIGSLTNMYWIAAEERE